MIASDGNEAARHKVITVVNDNNSDLILTNKVSLSSTFSIYNAHPLWLIASTGDYGRIVLEEIYTLF